MDLHDDQHPSQPGCPRAAHSCMRIIIAPLIFIALTGCSSGHPKLQERIAFWRNTLAKDVPVGTNAENIRAWGTAHHVKFDYLEQQQWLYANVAKIPEKGIHFPCSEWNIILKITIDSAGRSVKTDVSSVGSCI